jgi:hypothetical protein
MKGHGEKQSRIEDRAILSLLAEPTLERAAKKCGIGVTTLWRWLQEPEFQRRYREARRTVFEGSLLRLQAIAGEAVETLHRNLRSKNPSVEVRAALGVLDQAGKAAELYELQQRVAQLEEQLAAGRSIQ